MRLWPAVSCPCIALGGWVEGERQKKKPGQSIPQNCLHQIFLEQCVWEGKHTCTTLLAGSVEKPREAGHTCLTPATAWEGGGSIPRLPSGEQPEPPELGKRKAFLPACLVNNLQKEDGMQKPDMHACFLHTMPPNLGWGIAA